MSILIFSYGYPPAEGGVAVYSAEIARGFWEHGESVIVLAPYCKGSEVSDARKGFPIYRTPSMLVLRELWMLFRLPWLIRKHGVDRILSTVWLPCGVISWLVTRFLRIPYFLSAHGSEVFDTQNMRNPIKHQVRKRLRFLKMVTMKNAQAIFAVSENTRKLIISEGIPAENIFAIPNGVDSTRFRPLRVGGQIRAKYNLNGRKVILTVSRLDDYKGHDIVIKALPRILKEIPQAMYLIVGHGSERKRLERLAEKTGIADHILFAGYVPDDELVSYYNACDVFVMVPREDEKDIEGFGLVYLEANACGKPVIGGNSGGVRDAIIPGQTGVLVDPNDEVGLADAIVRLLSNPSEARKLGENGRLRSETELDWIHVTRRIQKLMEKAG